MYQQRATRWKLSPRRWLQRRQSGPHRSLRFTLLRHCCPPDIAGGQQAFPERNSTKPCQVKPSQAKYDISCKPETLAQNLLTRHSPVYLFPQVYLFPLCACIGA